MLTTPEFLEKLDETRFFLDSEACIVGRDKHCSTLLVEAFPEFAHCKQSDLKLVTAVAGSGPPRSKPERRKQQHERNTRKENKPQPHEKQQQQ